MYRLMNRRTAMALSVLFVASLVSPNLSLASLIQRPASRPPLQPKDRMIVVISLDGFPAWTLDDPALPVPTLRRMAREGTSAARMQISNPAVTWPNHTSMITGVQPEKHGVLYNGLLVRNSLTQAPKVEPWRDKSEMVFAPTVYDLAFKAGLTTAQVDWVAIQNPGTISWEFAERANPTGQIEKEMIAAGIVSQTEITDFSKNNSVRRDQIWTQAAIHILTKHKPNLMLFHLLNLDSVHHRYGPKTPAGYTAQAYIDSCVAQVVEALKAASLLERTTFLIVSDHGFKTAKRTIRANALLRQLGLIKGEGAGLTAEAYVIPEGGTAMAYVVNPANRERLLPQFKKALSELEGVEKVIEPPDFHSLGLPRPEVNRQMADLLVVAKDGYSFSGANVGEPVIDIVEGTNPGNHGYVSSDPQMDAIFIAWGYGVQPGLRLQSMRNIDIAPTIAAMLGLKLENIDGKRAF